MAPAVLHEGKWLSTRESFLSTEAAPILFQNHFPPQTLSDVPPRRPPRPRATKSLSQGALIPKGCTHPEMPNAARKAAVRGGLPRALTRPRNVPPVSHPRSEAASRANQSPSKLFLDRAETAIPAKAVTPAKVVIPAKAGIQESNAVGLPLLPPGFPFTRE